MKGVTVAFIFSAALGSMALLSACVSQKGVQEIAAPEDIPIAAAPLEKPVVPPGDAQQIFIPEDEDLPLTAGEKKEIFDEVKALVERLNRIISGNRYDAWLPYLSDDYLKLISSDVFLANASNAERFKQRGIKIKDTKDYFLNVVVPSRASIKVDEIEYVSHSRVVVYTLIKQQRFRVYDLIFTDAGWKITG
jgi:hypothetical protein